MVATRQPSEDKEFWHSETAKEEITGGAVSGAEEELLELDEDSLEEPASDEEDEAGKLDEEEEPASSAGKLDEPAEDELSANPVPPPPKPG